MVEKEKVAKLKATLVKERTRLEKELKAIEEGIFSVTESEQSGEMQDSFHLADTGTATFERERDLSLEQNVKDLLARVNTAIAHIDMGVYGSCSRCGDDIPTERLEALPYADLCIKCKIKEERG